MQGSRAIPTSVRWCARQCALATLLMVAPVVASTARAQSTAAERIAVGDRESGARHSAAAYAQFEAAVAIDPHSYPALWRAAREAVDLGEVERDAAARVTLYQHATDYARRAVAENPGDAEGYFHLARALGRTALSVGVRERVKYATDIRTNALRALSLSPRHPGALHVMGVWNAEIMRLNGIARAFARTFLGGQAFNSASWANATRYMEQSVAADPNRLVHRLDLARVYRDTGHTAEARAAYEAALRLPNVDANDDMYRRAAADELRALRQ